MAESLSWTLVRPYGEDRLVDVGLWTIFRMGKKGIEGVRVNFSQLTFQAGSYFAELIQRSTRQKLVIRVNPPENDVYNLVAIDERDHDNMSREDEVWSSLLRGLGKMFEAAGDAFIPKATDITEGLQGIVTRIRLVELLAYIRSRGTYSSFFKLRDNSKYVVKFKIGGKALVLCWNIRGINEYLPAEVVHAREFNGGFLNRKLKPLKIGFREVDFPPESTLMFGRAYDF
ncbi:unnamed protein product [Discosporangium mesarthrocarpum]